MKSKLIMWTFIIFAAALFGYNQISKHGYDPSVRHKIEEALKSPDTGRETRFGKSNYVQILGDKLRFTEHQIQKYLKEKLWSWEEVIR